MDIQSFYHLSPGEFEVIYKRWTESNERDKQNSWEQIRLVCYHAIRPYMKRKTSLKKFMPLPWDNKKKIKSQEGRKRDPRRFNMLKKKYGEKI